MSSNRRQTASYTEARSAAHEFLRIHSTRGEVLLVAPTRSAADDIVRELPLSTGVHRFAASDLAGTLAKRAMAERNLAPTTAIAVEALLTRVVHAMRPKLTYFGPVTSMPGFVRALSRTIADLRMSLVEAKSLARKKGPSRDLGVLLAAYEKELDGAGLIDFPGILRLGTENAGSHRLSALPCLWWFTQERSQAERLLRAAVEECSADWLSFDLASGGQPVDALGSVRRFLFGREQAPKRRPDASFAIFSASGEALECVEIARQIRFGGVPFDQVGVLLRDPDRYEPLMAEALRRAGMKAWFARGASRPDPSGRAFLALLQCAAEDVSVARFAEYLSLDQAPRNVRPARWEKMLTSAAIFHGAARWHRRLEKLRDSLAPGDPQREALHELEEFALPLVDRLASFPPHALWGEWLDQLEQIAGAALDAADAVQQLLAELRPMADAGPVTLADVIATLSAHLTTLRRRAEGTRYGCVWVGPIDLAAGMSFRVVFVPGLAEGGFPRRIAHDPLLLDEHRASISDLLETQQERTEAERSMLHRATASASQRLVASYPRMDLYEARRRVPSLYAFELLRAAEGWLPGELREFELRARSSSEATLGWPAPELPGNAIDNAEYDLSLLRRVRGRPEEKGALSYLKSAHPHLAEALRTRSRRWRTKWFAADGLVADQDVAALIDLDAHSLKRTAYAPSALQHFADCPYRFFLRSIIKVRPVDRPEAPERMEPSVRGELFHAAQTEVLRSLRSMNLLPVHRDNLRAAIDAAHACLDNIAGDYEEAFAPSLPGIWKANLAELRADLEGWLQSVAEQDGDWVPVNEELAFGLRMPRPFSDPASVEAGVEVFEAYRLAGSIDLVEQHTGTQMLRVTDHKTGRLPEERPAQLGGGRVLQPVLYALAAEKLLGKRALAGQLFYATRRENYERIAVTLDQSARDNAALALRTIDDAIHNGFLPAAPAEVACNLCDYKVVCGPYEGERVQLKPKDKLRELEKLRKLP